MVLPTDVAFKNVEPPGQTAAGVAVTTEGSGGAVCANDGNVQQITNARVNNFLAPSSWVLMELRTGLRKVLGLKCIDREC